MSCFIFSTNYQDPPFLRYAVSRETHPPGITEKSYHTGAKKNAVCGRTAVTEQGKNSGCSMETKVLSVRIDAETFDILPSLNEGDS